MKLLLFRSLFLPAAALCSSFAGAAFASPPFVKPPAQPKPTTPALYALGPPAALAIVTDKDNGGSVTLPPETTLDCPPAHCPADTTHLEPTAAAKLAFTFNFPASPSKRQR